MKPQNDIAIELKNVTKKYIIHHEKPTLVEKLITSRDETFTALDDISLRIYKGEMVGIVGPNGSGKTTLLKIISRIASPSGGKVITNGRIVSLIDLEAGFHPDLTGEQNIILNGLLIGMNRKEISNKLSSIIKLSGTGKFIDAPLFTYSQGMKLRLGFSVAVHADPDVLIMDEIVAVGDENFRKKSQKKIQEFLNKKKTLLIATHWLFYLKKNCTRIMVMKNGRIVADGGISVITTYGKDFGK